MSRIDRELIILEAEVYDVLHDLNGNAGLRIDYFGATLWLTGDTKLQPGDRVKISITKDTLDAISS